MERIVETVFEFVCDIDASKSLSAHMTYTR